MEKIIITFLGTGNAIPTEQRNHTGILLSFANENMLVDCGEGTQRQFRTAKLSPTKLTRLFITHWHGDHVLGIPGLLQTLAMSGYQRPLQIYGPRGSKRSLSLMHELFMRINIPFEVHEFHHHSILDFKTFQIEAQSMSHGTPTLAYALLLKDRVHLDRAKIKKLKLPSSPLLGQLQQGKNIMHQGKNIQAKDVTYREKGKKVVIILDTLFNERAIELAGNADLLITESTFAKEEAERAKEYKHLTASDAATIAKKAKVKQLILTHISQRYERTPEIIEKEAKKIFKNTRIVKDLDVVTI